MFLDVRNLTPTDATIVRPLLQGLAEKWHIIGGLLGFDKDALIKISSFGGSDESYLNIIITKWLCGDSSQPPTLESLITALKYINEGDTVTKLLKSELYIILSMSYNLIISILYNILNFQCTLSTVQTQLLLSMNNP